MKRFLYSLLITLCVGFVFTSCQSKDEKAKELSFKLCNDARHAAQNIRELPLGFQFGMSKDDVQDRIEELVEDGVVTQQMDVVTYMYNIITDNGSRTIETKLVFNYFHNEMYEMMFDFREADLSGYNALIEYLNKNNEGFQSVSYNANADHKDWPILVSYWIKDNLEILLRYEDMQFISSKNLLISYENAPVEEKKSNEALEAARAEYMENGGGSANVVNSSWDGSVRQVKKYLKSVLKDPKSYESIQWGAVKKTKDGFEVRHQYRAKNSFGGYVISDQIFYLDKQGNVVRVIDL